MHPRSMSVRPLVVGAALLGLALTSSAAPASALGSDTCEALQVEDIAAVVPGYQSTAVPDLVIGPETQLAACRWLGTFAGGATVTVVMMASDGESTDDMGYASDEPITVAGLPAYRYTDQSGDPPFSSITFNAPGTHIVFIFETEDGSLDVATSATVLASTLAGRLLGPVPASPAALEPESSAEPSSDAISSAPPSAATTPFQLPAEDTLEADRSLVLAVEPAAPADIIDVDPAIEAANATLDALPEDMWELEPLVRRMGNDPEAAFSFVRDSIGFEPYPGMLRGPQGTLSARAGNAHDRALLLKALLEAQGHTTRLALGELDAAAAAQLAERAFASVAEPLADASDLILAADLRDSIERRARRDYALLRPALDPHLTTESLAQIPDPASVVASHAWVQVLDGETWVDYDPSLPDARPGDVITPAARFYDEVLPIDRHAVTLRVVAETLADGWLSEAPVMEHRLDAADAAGRQILLLFQPGAGGGDLLGFGDVGTQTQHTPLLLMDGVAVPGTPFGTASAEDGGGSFADFGGFGGGGATGELAGLYLEAVLAVPGRPDEVHRRVLLDRVPPEARELDVVTPDILAPLAVNEQGPLALAGAHHLMVSTGGSDPRAHASALGHAAYLAATDMAAPGALEALPADAALWPVTVNDERLVVASEHVIVGSMRDAGVPAFVGRPRVSIVSLVPDPAASLGVSYTIDLMADSIDLMPTGDATPLDLARARVWYGALQSALETETIIRLAPAFEAGLAEIDSASLRHDSETVAPSLVPASAPVENAPTAMRRALAAGLLVITPDANTADAWWTVDPADGSTRSVLDPGLGSGKIAGARGGGAATVTPAAGSSQTGQNPFGQGQSGGSKEIKKPTKTPTGHSPTDKFEDREDSGGIERQLVEAETAVDTISATSFLYNVPIKGGFLLIISGIAASSASSQS